MLDLIFAFCVIFRTNTPVKYNSALLAKLAPLSPGNYILTPFIWLLQELSWSHLTQERTTNIFFSKITEFEVQIIKATSFLAGEAVR